MKTIVWALVLVLLLVADLGIAGDEKATVDKVTISDKSSASSGRFAIEWSCEPVPSDAGRFVFTAKITDLATDSVLSEPKIIVEKGTGGAQIRTGAVPDPKNPNSAMDISVKIDLDKDGKHFSLSTQITRGQEIIFKQRGSVVLP